MTKILFQGDSITDCGRSRDNDIYLGHGYPILVTSQLGFDNPEKFSFVNRAISGNRIVDIYARIKRDIIGVKPDVMSLLIGVNDVWHDYNDSPNGVDAEKFYKVYDMLIDEIKTALPDIKIMIMEPYVTHGTSIDPVWDSFDAEVKKRAEKAKLVAEKYNLTFVPLQKPFDDAFERFNVPTHWTNEGVHPTYFGHELIAREWLKAFEKLDV